MPSAYSTDTCCQLAGERVTVNSIVADSSSSTSSTGGELIDSWGTSSSVMVPVPFAVEILALTASLSAITNCSSGSSNASPFTVTSMFLLVSPTANSKVPLLIAT